MRDTLSFNSGIRDENTTAGTGTLSICWWDAGYHEFYGRNKKRKYDDERRERFRKNIISGCHSILAMQFEVVQSHLKFSEF